MLAFKINIGNKLKLSIANKLFQEQQRKPMTLGQPKLPTMKEQETHFVTHIPYAPWCQACVASRAKEDKHEARDEKVDMGRNVIKLVTLSPLGDSCQGSSRSVVGRKRRVGVWPFWVHLLPRS